MAIVSFTSDENLYLANYVYESELVDSNLNGFKIVQLSDFHNHGNKYKNGYVYEMVKNENPDAIFLTGDLIDQFTGIENLAQLKIFFDNLIDYPIYYVEGNHEHYASHTDEFFAMLNNYSNLTILRDNAVKVEHNGSSFNLIGLKDPKAQENDFDTDENLTRYVEPVLHQIKEGLDDELTILLSHRPNMMDAYVRQKMDLVFSGHTHGGQINLPLIKFFKYQSGRYDVQNTSLIVSNGIGSNGKGPIRFNCPMQLVSCTLKSK